MFYFKNLSLPAIVNVENLKAIFVSSNYQACQATTFNFQFISIYCILSEIFLCLGARLVADSLNAD